MYRENSSSIAMHFLIFCGYPHTPTTTLIRILVIHWGKSVLKQFLIFLLQAKNVAYILYKNTVKATTNKNEFNHNGTKTKYTRKHINCPKKCPGWHPGPWLLWRGTLYPLPTILRHLPHEPLTGRKFLNPTVWPLFYKLSTANFPIFGNRNAQIKSN